MIIDRFPKIREMAINIACDNGMINRFCSAEEFLATTEEVLGSDGITEEDLRAIDKALEVFSEDELLTLAGGEYEDTTALLKRVPEEPRIGPDGISLRQALDGILNDIFDRDTEYAGVLVAGSWRPEL